MFHLIIVPSHRARHDPEPDRVRPADDLFILTAPPTRHCTRALPVACPHGQPAGRAYGTGCQHEHACIRCPMLRPDPVQHERLSPIIASLDERITEAVEHGWLGEVDGLRTSRAAAEHKLTQMQRTATNLGMPVVRSKDNRPAAPPT